MARIVLISPDLKGGQNAAKLMHRTRYVATHPGVEPAQYTPRHEKGLLNADAHVKRFGNVFFAPQ